MGLIENPAALRLSRFQAAQVDTEPARKPKTVVSQTDTNLELYMKGIIGPEMTLGYVKRYTLPFLNTAEQGAVEIFRDPNLSQSSLPLEIIEAANFSKIVFAWMHHFAVSRLLPDGYARHGVLQAPQTSRDFASRIREIRSQLGLLVANNGRIDRALESNPPLLRTLNFFRVGEQLPQKFVEDDTLNPDFQAETARKLLSDLSL